MFDITTRGRIPFDITSGQEVARAAWRLMNECVRDQGGQGGVVTGIGMYRKLLYQPPIGDFSRKVLLRYDELESLSLLAGPKQLSSG